MKIVLRVSFVVYICENTVIPAAAHHNVCLPRHLPRDTWQLPALVPGDTGTVVLQFYIVLKLVFSIWHELVLGLVDNVAIRQRKQVAIKTECRPPPAAAADNVEEWTKTRQNMTNNCGVTVGPHYLFFFSLIFDCQILFTFFTNQNKNLFDLNTACVNIQVWLCCSN